MTDHPVSDLPKNPEPPSMPPDETDHSGKLVILIFAAAVAVLGLVLASKSGSGLGSGVAAVLARNGLLGVLFLVGGGLYAVPTLIAWRRQHRDVLALGALNLFLGWTFVGWVIALVWSLRASDRASR